MSNKTRKGVRPTFLAVALGAVAMLAVLAALALPSGSANAQDNAFAPGAPTAVTAAANDDGTQVMVTWTADTTHAPATGYEVERMEGSGDWMSASPAHTGTAAEYPDPSVSDGVTYKYRVRATNNFGSSVWVESNAVTVSTVGAPLDMPGNPMTEADDNRQLTVSWDAVMGASGYQVSWNPADENGNTSHELGAGATSYTITDLAPNTTYAIEIVALGVDGTSRDSEAAMVSGTTLPVAYDLLLSHEADDGSMTCADRSQSRPQCSSDVSEFADGDFEEVESMLGGASDRIDQATIRAADKRIRLHAEVNTDSPETTTTVTIRIQNSDGTDGFDADPGIIYNTAGLNAPGVRSIEDGTLDIQIRDKASRVFDVYVTCMGTPESLTGTLDLEVRDEDQELVAQATIMCAPPIEPDIPEERVSACYTISGMPDQGDDPDTAMVEGEDIELLTSDKSVVLTVSAYEKTYKTTTVGSVTTIEDPEDCADWDPSSVFIRLVDGPGEMMPMVDENGFVDANGFVNDHGQVVGLSSGGELMLDIAETVPAPRTGDDPIGVVRGTFRVFTPADVEMGDKYYVELYDNLLSNRIRHQNAETGAEQDYERVVYCSDPATAAGACEVPPNNAPMVGAAIADQMVTAGMTVMVQSTITDADMDDTLTWSAMSSMPSYATATVDNMGMVTIMGVASGMATITVTATDMEGAYAMQTIMVTVTAAELTAPTGVMATVDDSDPSSPSVTVTWTNGENAVAHVAGLLQGSTLVHVASAQTDGTATFHNVMPGTYLVGVAAFDADFNLQIGVADMAITVQ